MQQHLESSDDLTRKLKEDTGIKEREIEELKQELFDCKKQRQEELRIRETQVRQFFPGESSCETMKTATSGRRFWFLNFSTNQSLVHFSLGGALPGGQRLKLIRGL